MRIAVQQGQVVEVSPGLFGVKLIDGSNGAGQLSLARGWLKPGATHGLHTHPSEEAVYFISGEGELELDGHRYSVRGGDSVRFPPHSKHSTRNTHPTDDLVFVTAFSDQIIVARPCVPAWKEGRITRLLNQMRWVFRRVVHRIAG